MMPPDTIPGTDSAMTRFTSGVSLGHLGHSAMPARRHAMASSAYWAMPDMNRPQAKIYPVIGVLPVARIHATTFEAIITRFNRIGAAAAALKRLRLLSTPDCNAVSDMKSR